MKKPADHLKLVSEMARRTGTPLEGGAGRLPISADVVGSLTDRCRECLYPEACRAFLMDQDNSISQPPEYCTNRHQLLRLKSTPE